MVHIIAGWKVHGDKIPADKIDPHHIFSPSKDDPYKILGSILFTFDKNCAISFDQIMITTTEMKKLLNLYYDTFNNSEEIPLVNKYILYTEDD